LTANPPQINYTVPEGINTDLSDKLTAWSYQQFDKSGEAMEHRKMIQSAQTFGWGVSKLFWDTVEVNKQFFRSFVPGQPNTAKRSDLMRLEGADDGDISTAVKEGGEDLGDAELYQAISRHGNTAQIPTKISQFEGPVSKNIFIGDFFMEPGAASLNVSGWAVENYWESDVWLKKMLAKTYIVPGTQDEQPIFDSKAVQELMEMPSWQPIYQQQPFDLRSRLRTNSLGQTLPLWPTKLLRGKRYDILECHTKDADGQFWIEWVGNEKTYLGKMPYPWDLYGKYCYTELSPMFDLLTAYGDSTPLLLRHLWLLHNAIVGSRRDLVANLLRPLMKARIGTDIPDEQVDRALMRIIFMRDPDSIQPMTEALTSIGPALQAATEEEAQNLRMMALAEPNLTNVETGTEANPQAGKTATTAVLAAKSADALTQFEIDSLSWYLKESGEKKLAMLQQTEPESDPSGAYKPYQIGAKYTEKLQGWTQRYGKTSVANLDFMELQQEIQVEPAAMSFLSVDDELRRNAAVQLLQMAAQMPNIVDPYYSAHFFAETIRGINADKAVPPPRPPTPPPPKVSLAVAAKWAEVPVQLQEQFIGAAGAPPTTETTNELNIESTLHGIEKASVASDHADNLMSTKSVDDPPETPMSKGVGNPTPARTPA